MTILENDGKELQEHPRVWFAALRRRVLALRMVVSIIFLALGFAAALVAGDTLWTFGQRAVEGVVEAWTEAWFYRLPNPIPSGAPGQLVRSQQLNSIFDGALAWRVLYHSTDVHGNDFLV